MQIQRDAGCKMEARFLVLRTPTASLLPTLMFYSYGTVLHVGLMVPAHMIIYSLCLREAGDLNNDSIDEMWRHFLLSCFWLRGHDSMHFLVSFVQRPENMEAIWFGDTDIPFIECQI